MMNKTLESFLLNYNKEEITDLLNDDNDSTHVSINLNLVTLKQQKPLLYKNVITNVWKVATDWDGALLEVQKKIVENGNAFLEPEFQIKENCHVRFFNIPSIDNNLKGNFPTIHDIGQFVQIKGNVIRMAQQRLIEYQREYICTKCKETFLFEAEYGKLYIFDIPKYCPNNINNQCRGNLQPKNAFPKPNFCKDYQELRLQEMQSKKKVPLSILVCLENDLVDICVPGECITICGTIEFRRQPFIADKNGEVVLTLKAVSISKDEKKVNLNKDYSEKMVCVRAQWEDDCNIMGQLNARDLIIRSICPEIYGMYLVKLSLALSLCSGMEDEQSISGSGVTKRGNSHLLLIGDAGLAKSNLLKSASKIAVRSVHTTGLGCSAAGLTAAAVRDEGEIQLEAGALVLADGGVCCIDEFNLMREHDKASIHEAMEQQTISIAKAGLVSKLNARCVILAAANPRCLYSMSDSEGSMALNTGIASPLLSRFDLIFLLRDDRNPEWDANVADHLLKITTPNMADKFWNLDRLQSHFLAAHEIKPKLSPEANLIVSSYYKMCRSDYYRDPSRTSVRLLDSLNRLAQSHARLMLRSEVLGIDAVIIVRLMESTWGFGSLLPSINVIKKDFPLGPDHDEINQVLNVLGLHNLEEKLLEQLKCLESNNLPNDSVWNNSREKSKKFLPKEVKRKSEDNAVNINNLEKLFGYQNQPKRAKITRIEPNREHIAIATNKCNDNNVSVKSEVSDIIGGEEPKTTKKIIHSTPADEDWNDNDFDLSLNVLEYSYNELKKDSTETIVKEKTPILVDSQTSDIEPGAVMKFCSMYDDPDFDDVDLDLDVDFLGPKIETTNTKNDKLDQITQADKNEPSTSDCSKTDTELHIKTASEPVATVIESSPSPNKKSDTTHNSFKVFSNDHSIHYLASQYDDLDFLESD